MGEQIVGKIELGSSDKARVRTLAYMIAHEAKCLGEYKQGAKCSHCKECLLAISKYLDEFLLEFL